MQSVVLQKYMASCGVDSRRKCQNLIEEKRVKINGTIATLGSRVIPGKDIVLLDDKKIEPTSKDKLYVMIYKPRGFVTTLKDEFGRKCVAQLVSEIPTRLFPVGRLDKDSEGLLLMTNDGDFANKIIHPSKEIWKTYRVTVKPHITEDNLTQICIGMTIDDYKTLPARAELIRKYNDRSIIEISIHEGKNRQIRKMCEKLNLEVLKLKRISIGSLKLGQLRPGKFKLLSKDDIKPFIN